MTLSTTSISSAKASSIEKSHSSSFNYAEQFFDRKTKAELDSMVVAIKKKPKEVPKNKFFKPPVKKLDDKRKKTYYIPNSKAVSAAKSNSF